QITCCNPGTFRQSRVLIEVTTKFSYSGKEQGYYWYHYGQFNQLYTPLVPPNTTKTTDESCPHDLTALPIKDWFHDWWARVWRSTRVVKSATNIDGYADVFSLNVATVSC